MSDYKFIGAFSKGETVAFCGFCVFLRVFKKPEICAARTSGLEPSTVGKRSKGDVSN